MLGWSAAVIGIPFLGAIVCLAVRDKLAKYFGVAAGLLTAGVAVRICVRMPSETYLFGEMPWLGRVGEQGLFGYQIDPLACIMLLAAAVIGAVIAIYSSGYLSEGNLDHPTSSGQARYYFWLMIFVGSMAGIALSPTLLQLLIFWELTTLCSWALISFYNDDHSLRAGMKALVITSFGGLFFMAALVWILTATGSAGFGALGLMSPAARSGAFVLLLIAAWAKSAQFPFSTWLPDAMAAPTPISAYLHAAAMVKAGVFLVARLLTAGWDLASPVGLILSIFALVTMFGALYFYFLQDDLKRLLAYSTITQLGYIFLGLGLGALGASMAMRGAVLHILMHSVAKTTLFLTVGAIGYACGTRSISKLWGLSKTMPLAAVAFFVGAFALTGIPPLACFWSKVYILAGALQIGGFFGPLVLILVLVESLAAFGWFLWVGQKVFLGRSKPEADKMLETEAPEEAGELDPPPSVDWMLVLMILLTIAAPIAGIPLVQRIVLP
jgi:hydrogenase-4 component D